jgi:hypothetical protein
MVALKQNSEALSEAAKTLKAIFLSAASLPQQLESLHSESLLLVGPSGTCALQDLDGGIEVA